MRILIVGAGALGGYFGARLLQADRDVTFLVRPRRAAQLAKTGLVVRSKLGDAHIPSPPHVLAENISDQYDLILVGCKAYDLVPTMESFASAVGPGTAILPFLNGMKHLDSLSERFGAQHVLGGLAMISASLDDDGIVLHLNETHVLAYGEIGGARSPRIDAISATFAGAKKRGERELSAMRADDEAVGVFVPLLEGNAQPIGLEAPLPTIAADTDWVTSDSWSMASATPDSDAATSRVAD